MSKNIHIVPDNGRWSTKVQGVKTPLKTFKTQASAISHGKKIARGLSSELIIHRRNGQIRERNSYGSDPYPPAG